MAKCVVNTGSFAPVVEKLIQSNPAKFKSFDNVASFILSSNLNDEQKALSLHNIAHIFQGLSSLDSAVYELGKGPEVLRMENLVDKPDEYLQAATGLFDLGLSSASSEKAITTAINNLSSQKKIVGPDIEEVFGKIDQFVSSRKFNSEEEENELYENLVSSLKDTIENTTVSNKSFLLNKIDLKLSQRLKKSNYIPLSEVVESANLDTLLANLSDGSIVEGQQTPDGFVIIDSTGNEVVLPESAIVGTPKEAIPQGNSVSNTGKFIFQPGQLISGFKAVPFDRASGNSVYHATRVTGNLQNMVRVHAVRVSDMADQRVQRIQAVAENNPELADLKNRTLETFENREQVRKLQSGANQEVLTVSRPLASDQSFAFIGEVIETGEKFVIYGPTNMTIVDSENYTTKVDITNPVHVEKIKKLSATQKREGTSITEVPINDMQIAALQRSYEQFARMGKKIQEELDRAENNAKTSIDVSDIFFQEFATVNTRSSNAIYKPLPEELAQNSALTFTATVGTYLNNELVSTEERQIPVMFFKYSKNAEFEVVEHLAENEGIVLTRKDGTQVRTNIAAFVRDSLNITETEIENLLGKDYETVFHFILRKATDGGRTFNIIERNAGQTQLEQFAHMASSLAEVMSEINKTAFNAKTINTLFNGFHNNEFGFKFANPRNPANGSLTFQFTVNKQNDIVLEVRGNRSTRYADIINNSYDGENILKNNLNFKLNRDYFTRLFAIVNGSHPMVKAVVAKYPSLRGLDLSNSKDRLSFFSQLTTLGKGSQSDPVISSYLSEVFKMQTELGSMLKTMVSDKIEKRLAGVSEQMLEMMKEDFQDFSFLMTDVMKDPDNPSKNVYLPKLLPKKANGKVYYGDLNSYSIKLVPLDSQLTIVSQSGATSFNMIETKATTAVQEPIVTVQEDAPVTAEVNLTDSVDLDDIPDESAYSIAEGVVTPGTQGDIAQEAAFLRDMLPQFGLSEQDISEIVDLTKIDGTVLGLFKDRAIYLNKSLNVKGVVYHEAFHGVFRFLMNDQQRKDLISQVQRSGQYKSRFTVEALKEFARVRNIPYNKETISNLMAEEILAEGFQKYMLSGTKPSANWFKKFVDMLKRILDMFNLRRVEIESVYGDISTGYYKNATIKSGLFEGQTAYEIIEGPTEVYLSAETNTPTKRRAVMTGNEQRQLVYLLSHNILNDSSSTLSFEEKFEKHRKELYDLYNIEQFKSLPTNKKIIEKYGRLFNIYRFVLGAQLDNPALANKAINSTGNPGYNNQIKNIATAEKSVEALKDQVKEVLRHFRTTDVPIDPLELTASTAQNIINGTHPEMDMDDYDAEQEGNGSDQFDKNSFGINVLDGLPKEMRRFFSLVMYEESDTQLGIKLPKMIDGSMIFNTIMKITSDTHPDNIIEKIRTKALEYQYDGFTEASKELMSVYEKLDELTGLSTNNGKPVRNHQLYHQLIDVFHTTELEYKMFNVYTDKVLNQFSDPMAPEGSGETNTSFTLIDALLKQDINKKRDKIVSSILSTYRKNSKDKDFLKNVNKLQKFVTGINRSEFLLNAGEEDPNIFLENKVIELHELLNNIGLNLPKSLLRLSLMAIERVENQRSLEMTHEAMDHYRAHHDMVLEGQYLQKSFFEDLGILTSKMSLNVSADQLSELIERNSDDKTAKRFNAVFSKAARYLVKYDPSELPSVVRNAEGKPIYRYVKYTPAAIISQDIRQNGLKSALSKSRFYNDYLSDYFGDNALVGAALKDDNSVESETAKLFFQNMFVSAFGGVRQSLDGVSRDGKTFKDIDDKSLYLANVMAFMKRDKIVEKRQVLNGDVLTDESLEIEVFERSLTQLEASQTNFLIRSLFKSYIDQKGNQRQFEFNGQKYGLVVQELESAVKQEYNRITREWGKQEERKAKFQAGENTIINKFNGEYDNDGNLVTDKDSLRAYQFNKLADFFYTGTSMEDALGRSEEEVDAIQKRIQLREDLRNLAKDNIGFDDIDADTRTMLLKELSSYAENEFQKHIEKLVSIDAVQVTAPKPKTNAAGEVITQGKDGPALLTKTTINSTLFPEEIKFTGQDPIDVSYIYGKNDVGKANIEALLRDFYYNYWVNSLTVNEIFDGDMGMNVKDAINYFKRNKSLVAAGSTMKRGYHRTAIMQDLKVWMAPDYLEFGQYDTYQEAVAAIAEMVSENKITSEKGEDIISNMTQELVFDGMSISLLMHQMDMFESMGRLNPMIEKLLIKKHYTTLSPQEIAFLESNKVVVNSKKTVTADRSHYHKQSEHQLDRADVSYIDMSKGKDLQDIHSQLDILYTRMYNMRKMRQERILANEELSVQTGLAETADALNTADVKDLDTEIQRTGQEIHAFWKPLPHRKQLHDILNSMEYHQIDQLMDTNSSKKLTMLPVDITKSTGREYYDFNMSMSEVDNRFKYLQVETSGIKDSAKASVQSKVLIAADFENLRKLAEKSGMTEGVPELLNTLNKYQDTLGKLTNANYQKLKQFMRDENGNFDIAEIFELIHSSLNDQGANQNTLKFFEVKNGKPVHSVNLPAIRQILTYYFVSIYSNTVTDEHVAGFKSFHVTSYGYNLVYTKRDVILNGKQYYKNDVIPTDIVRQNPELFSDKSEFGNRYPGVTSEINPETGITTYFVEAIIPKPSFKNAAEEAFFMEKLSKMFATRIPTEDKRSMIAIKVVDFIDPAYQNTIVLPQLIHTLAGSDLDIDSLFGQMYAHYTDFMGTPHRYGDAASTTEKYLEYLHFMMNDKLVKADLKRHSKEILKAGGELSLHPQTIDIMEMMGANPAILNRVGDSSILRDYIDELKDEHSELKNNTYVPLRLANEEAPLDADWIEQGEVSEKLRALYADITEAKEDLYEIQRALKMAVRINTLLDVMGSKNMPFTMSDFVKQDAYKFVTPAFQNQNLDQKLDILSNPAVFEHLYIREKSSTDRFKQVLDILGVSPEDIANKYNAFTIDGVINVRSLNAVNKDGIGITANLNKFLALASQHNLELKDDQVIWRLSDNSEMSKSIRTYNQFGQMSEDDQRTIALVGNILGMFADGAKDPIPGALQMNEENTAVSLAMIGVGLPIEMSLFINLFKEIKEAVQETQASKTAISASNDERQKFLTSVLSEKLKFDILGADKFKLLEELKAAGIITSMSSAARPELDKKRLRVSYTTPERVNNLENPTPEELGFNIETTLKTSAGEKIELSQEAQKAVIVILYQQQAQQNFELQSAGRTVNMFKRLAPDFERIDKIRESFNKLADPNLSIFKNSDALFYEGSVMSVLRDTLEDLDNQSARIFMERTQAFSTFTAMYGPIFKSKKTMADTIFGYFMLRKMGADMENAGVQAGDANAKRNRDNFNAMLEPEFWFGASTNPGVITTLQEDIEALEKYDPKNKAVSYLKLVIAKERINVQDETGKAVVVPALTKQFREQYIEQTSKAKLSGELAEQVIDDFTRLLKDVNTRPIAKKLYFHELIRSGLGVKPGMFMNLVNTDLMKELSTFADEFMGILKDNVNNPDNMLDAIQSFLKLDSREQVEDTFQELIYQSAYAATQEDDNKAMRKVYDLKGERLNGFFSKNDKGNPDMNAAGIALSNIFSTASNIKVFPGKFNPSSGLQVAGTKFEVNFTKQPAITQQGMNEIAKSIGAAYDPMTKQYSFKLALEAASFKSKLILTSVDGVPVSKLIADNISYASPEMTGLRATYEVVDNQLTSTKVSPLAFSMDNARKYAAILKGKQKLTVSVYQIERITNPVEEIKVVAPIVEETTQTEAVVPESVIIEPGRYVTYEGQTFIVTKILPNGTIQIYNPTLTGAGSKRAVKIDNLTPRVEKAKFTTYRGSQYMITPKSSIISIQTMKEQKWSENSGDRKGVLLSIMDIENLNLTDDVLMHLYNESSKTKTFETFRKEAIPLINNLRVSTSNSDIAERVKCL